MQKVINLVGLSILARVEEARASLGVESINLSITEVGREGNVL